MRVTVGPLGGTVNARGPATFDEAAQQLRVAETGHTGSLRLSSVVGCLGQLQNGNTMDVVFTWNLTSPDGRIDLS